MIGKILRTIGKFVFGTLFTLMLAGSLLVMGLANFTEFDNLKKIAGGLVGGQISDIGNSEQIRSGLRQLKETCKGADSVEIDLQDRKLSVNCNDINKADDAAIGSVIADELLQKIYYQKYDCDFISCLTQVQQGDTQPLTIILSQKANEFFKQIRIYAWIATALVGAAFFFLIEGWSNRLKNFGITFIFVGLPFFALDYIKSLLVKNVQQEFLSVINPLVDSLFKPVSQTYMAIFAAGIVLVGAAIIVKYKVENKQPKKK